MMSLLRMASEARHLHAAESPFARAAVPAAVVVVVVVVVAAVVVVVVAAVPIVAPLTRITDGNSQ